MILDDILTILKENSNYTAYTIGNKSYTYSELHKFICNLYNFILTQKNNNNPIVIYGHKEVYMKACFLACSFAGVAYVPIDESMPKNRVEQIIKQVNPSLLIGNFNNETCKNISKEKIYEIMNNSNYKEIENIYLKPNDIYYIIFTSGSTGIPKGVKVTYKNLDSCIKWLKSIIKISNSVILNQANFSFDLSVADLYLSLVSESEHFIIDTKSNLNFEDIFKQFKKSNAEVAVMTPSFVDLLMLDKSFGIKTLPKLKTFLFCGEKLLNSTVNKLYSRFADINIINSYGPTECTFAVTSINIFKYTKEEIPVGFPKDDVKIYIVNEENEELKEGKIGEILISGESVANGYLGDVNNKSFIQYKGEKSYLTGDLGYIKNGILYCRGRKDSQIKYKGYRIELSDIEKNLMQIQYVEKVIVTVKKSENDKVQDIFAFIKLIEDSDKSETDIKKQLKAKLPEYMCPKIKIIKEFPINQNGKVDLNKLMEEN